MLGGDAGFRVEAREHVAAGRALQPFQAELHPARDPIAIGPAPRGAAGLRSHRRATPAGRVEVHEREQGEGLRDRAHGMLRQQRGQPDGLVAQLAADRLLGVRGEVSLVEQQVEHRVHAGQPRAAAPPAAASRASGGASRSRSRARARRLCTLASEVNSRSAISAVLKPHSVFSASTSRDSRGMASSQQTKSIRSMSSRTSPAK